MTTRSALIAYGDTAGTGPVSIYTGPAGVTTLIKWGSGSAAGVSPGSSTALTVHQKPAGGSFIPCAVVTAYYSDTAGRATAPGLLGLWMVIEPGDELGISDDGVYNWQAIFWGAVLLGVAP